MMLPSELSCCFSGFGSGNGRLVPFWFSVITPVQPLLEIFPISVLVSFFVCAVKLLPRLSKGDAPAPEVLEWPLLSIPVGLFFFFFSLPFDR